MNRILRTSQFAYENLEDRKMLAGDVSVVQDGQLYIRGDELSNQIRIIADETGQVMVEGLNSTTINGSSNPFQVSNTVNLNGERGRNAAFEGGLRIQTFGGNDRIDIQGIELNDLTRIETGEGDDFVRFIRSTSRHNFFANTDFGDDTLNFVQTRVHGEFDVITGNGEDSIRLHNSRTWGDTMLRSGSGDDSLRINRVRFSGVSQIVMAQAGHDLIEVRNNDVNEAGLRVLAGHGRDHVFAEMQSADELDGEILLAGQLGYDVMEMNVDEAMIERVLASGFELSGDLVYDDGTDGVSNIFSASGSWSNTELDNYRTASNIIPLDTTETISRISWSGAYGQDINGVVGIYESDDFTIEFYEGAPSAPVGAPIASFNVGNDVNRVDTGIELELGGLERSDIFAYSADIDITLEAGKNYWVSIYAAVEADVPIGSYGGNYSVWFWSGGPGENPDANFTAYTFAERTTPWYNNFGGAPYGSADFQLWS